MVTKANLKPCHTSETEFFSQDFMGYSDDFRSCQTSKMECFAEIVKN